MEHLRRALLVLSLLLPLLALLIGAPITQDPGYHVFADARPWLGVPNFWNVATNLPFLWVGLRGIDLCRRGAVGVAERSWLVLFVGAALVSVGSAYYHWQPDDRTLVWDRLPMTIGFMGLLLALVTEFVDTRAERWGLWPAVTLGMASVGHWVASDDLRLYYWIQGAPLLAIVVTITLFNPRYSGRSYFAMALALYLLAKLAEAADTAVYAHTHQLLSGHSIKHLLAAAALWSLLQMLRTRVALTHLPRAA